MRLFKPDVKQGMLLFTYEYVSAEHIKTPGSRERKTDIRYLTFPQPTYGEQAGYSVVLRL